MLLYKPCQIKTNSIILNVDNCRYVVWLNECMMWKNVFLWVLFKNKTVGGFQWRK